MSAEDDAAAVLALVVPIGDTPTQQELELGVVVSRHITDRSLPQHRSDPNMAATLRHLANDPTSICPTCGRPIEGA
jgi:hypothetical protein